MEAAAMMEMQGNGNWRAMKTENAKCGILPNTYTNVKMRTRGQKRHDCIKSSKLLLLTKEVNKQRALLIELNFPLTMQNASRESMYKVNTFIYSYKFFI